MPRRPHWPHWLAYIELPHCCGRTTSPHSLPSDWGYRNYSLANRPILWHCVSWGRSRQTDLTRVGACAMTTKFLDNKICTFKILLSWRFPRKKHVFGRFASLPPNPHPLRKANFIFIVVSLSLTEGEQTRRNDICVLTTRRHDEALNAAHWHCTLKQVSRATWSPLNKVGMSHKMICVPVRLPVQQSGEALRHRSPDCQSHADTPHSVPPIPYPHVYEPERGTFQGSTDRSKTTEVLCHPITKYHSWFLILQSKLQKINFPTEKCVFKKKMPLAAEEAHFPAENEVFEWHIAASCRKLQDVILLNHSQDTANYIFQRYLIRVRDRSAKSYVIFLKMNSPANLFCICHFSASSVRWFWNSLNRLELSSENYITFKGDFKFLFYLKRHSEKAFCEDFTNNNKN